MDAKAQTRAELAEYLARKDVPTQISEQLLDRFEEVGLLNDQLYAQAWVESRRRSRNLSATALKRELRTKGLDDQIIAQATETITTEDDRQAAVRLARQKAPALAKLDRQVAFRRLAGQLARRGHSPAVTMSVVKQVLGELDGDMHDGDMQDQLDDY